MMTKQHFQALADVVNDAMENMDQSDTRDVFLAGKVAGIEEIANSLADMAQRQNPRFNRQLFLTACGLDAKVKA